MEYGGVRWFRSFLLSVTLMEYGDPYLSKGNPYSAQRHASSSALMVLRRADTESQGLPDPSR